MAMPGTGCFIGWYDLEPGRKSDHDHWHTHEHMIERVAIPGFLRGFRYRALTGGPRTCVIYQADRLETLNSAAYIERLNNPTPWSEEMLAHFAGMNRTMCTVIASHGAGIGGFLLTIQVSALPNRSDELSSWLKGKILPDIAGRAGFCATHFLIGEREVSQTQTQEKELRGEPDAIADWVVLIEGYDCSAVEQVQAELFNVDGFFKHGASDEALTAIYTLDYSLGEAEAKTIWKKQ